jgi:glycerol-3-phosphate acyltransferase PlsX
MGGDYGPKITIPAALSLLAKHPNVELILVGNQEILDTTIASYADSTLKNRIRVQHASEEVLMDELPAKALRTKKDSSMRVAINLVKEGIAQACVSAGNTGALVATARFVLKTLPGIDRPAITTYFPTMVPNKNTNILDLGANINSSADYLCQLAAVGTVMSKVINDILAPKVALLNIGSEEIKGNEQIKLASHMLTKNKNVNYVGFIEGDELFRGNVDVVVCDGFVGNIVLKTIEGALKLVTFYAKRNMLRNIFTKLTALLAFPMLKKLQKDLDPGKYNGAALIGLRGIVIKSHGSANVAAFVCALENAIIEVEKNVPQKIHDELTKILQEQGTTI